MSHPSPSPRPLPAVPATVASSATIATVARRAGLPLTAAALVLTFFATGLAAVLAWLLAQGLDLSPASAAALGAAAGLVAAALPVGMLLRRLAPPSPPLAEAAPAIDPGTGAASHAALLDMAAREWSRARRYGTGAAVLLVDVDRFARLCDARGPDAGEAVLRELARQIAPTLRGADVLARSGGAQLAVFLVQADAMGALDVAERIRERAEQLEVPWHPQRLRFTVSLGVAHLRPAHDSVQALFDDAGDAVQAAREAGGNCVRAAPVERRGAPEAGTPRSDDQRTRPS